MEKIFIAGVMSIVFTGLMVQYLNRVRRDSLKKEPKAYPKSPCGNDKAHHYWTEEEGWPCPCCHAIERNKREAAEETRKMQKMARILVAEQRRHK